METIETILKNKEVLLKQDHVNLLIPSETILLKDNLIYLTDEYIYYLFGDKNRGKGTYKDPKMLRIPLSGILMDNESDVVLQKNIKTNRYRLAINCEDRWLYFIFNSSLDEVIQWKNQIIANIKELGDNNDAKIILIQNGNDFYAQKKRENEEDYIEEVKVFLAKCQNDIDTVKELKKEVQNKQMESSLNQLVISAQKCIDYVNKYPVYMNQLKHLGKYYLPNTIQLLQNYTWNQTNEAQKKTVKEIEDFIVVEIQAFDALYDKMNSDISLDIHTDIDTMKKLMEQDDLIGDK